MIYILIMVLLLAGPQLSFAGQGSTVWLSENGKSLELPAAVAERLPPGAYWRKGRSVILFPGQPQATKMTTLWSQARGYGLRYFRAAQISNDDLLEDEAIEQFTKAYYCLSFALALYPEVDKAGIDWISRYYQAESLRQISLVRGDEKTAKRALKIFAKLIALVREQKNMINNHEVRLFYVRALTADALIRLEYDLADPELLKLQLQEADAYGEEIGFKEANRILENDF